MKDLLNSLIVGDTQTLHSNSSQDSFYSTEEQGKPRSLSSAAPNLNDASSHNGVQVYDVDSYLADPNNAGLLQPEATGANIGKSKKEKPCQENQTLQPIQLGIQTSHYVSLLYQECQAKGLTPIFEIEGEASQAMFRGVLKIRDTKITLDDYYRNKKEARERLAEKGVEVIKGMEARKRVEPATGVEGGGGKEPNWVGMLQEYHNLEFGPTQSPVYTFYALGQSYACTAVIPSHPDMPFGSPTQPFLSKKLAHRSAAAAAVQFLISEGKLNADGSTIARKKANLGAGRSVNFQAERNVLKINKEATFAQKVNDIAPMLGLNTPVYHLNPESMDAPNILSGYMCFPNSPDLPASVGEVRNVFGKKAAKEEIAKGAWEALLNLADGRGVKLGKEVDRG